MNALKITPAIAKPTGTATYQVTIEGTVQTVQVEKISPRMQGLRRGRLVEKMAPPCVIDGIFIALFHSSPRHPPPLWA